MAKRAEQLAYYRSNMRKRDRDMIRPSPRATKGTSDPAAVEALRTPRCSSPHRPDRHLSYTTANLPVVHPEKVRRWWLVRGEYDGIATVADLRNL